MTMSSLPRFETAVNDGAVMLPVVHCFEFQGTRFAFLVRTGDLMRVSRPAFEALASIERGADRVDAIERLRSSFTEEQLDVVARDLEVLEQGGFLTPELRLTERQLDASCEQLLAHKPRNLMFFVTEACNLACTYCYEKNQGVHDKPLTLKQVDARKTLDHYFVESGGRDVTVTFFGGEPLLNFAVVRDATLYAESKGLELGVGVGFTITTNLTLLTEEIADFLAAHKFHVMVSLDGDKEGNDRHRVFRDGGGTYDTAVANLRMLIEKLRTAGVRLPKLRATMTSENLDPIAVERHLRSLGTPLVEVGATHGTVERGLEAHDVGNDREQVERIHARSQEMHARLISELEASPDRVPEVPGFVVKNLRRIHEDVSQTHVNQTPAPKLCGVCRNMKAVTPGGDLYPCHRYVGMPAFKFGNVHTGGMDRERVRGYYADLHRNYGEHCTKCWARYLCGGQCPWYLSTADGRVVPPDEESCNGIRRNMETSLGLYATLLERFPAAFRRLVAADPEAIRGASPVSAPDESCGM